MKKNQKTKKRTNKKKQAGFTLIELLAVITIMGILMLVAIPAISRTIENSRRNTFANTALQYVSAIKNSISADEIKCGTNIVSATPNGYYYYSFDSEDETGTDLMESGGRSSWGNSHVKGYVAFKKTVVDDRTTYVYAVTMVDAAQRGFGDLTWDESVSRTTVKTSAQTQTTSPAATISFPAHKVGDTDVAAHVPTTAEGGWVECTLEN